MNYPTEFAGSKVIAIRDLTIGYDSETKDYKARLPTSGSSQMITFQLENGCLMTLRTSGTEPKIKYYTEFKSTSLDKARKELEIYVEAMLTVCLEPEINGLS